MTASPPAGPERRDDGHTLVEMLAVVALLGVVLAMVFQALVSVQRSADGAADRADADAEIGLLVEVMGRDVRSAVPMSTSAGAPIIVLLDGDTVVIQHDRDGDKTPTRVEWDRSGAGSPLVRSEYTAIADTGPNWEYPALASRVEEYLPVVGPGDLFTAIAPDGTPVTSCDATVDPAGCLAVRLLVDLDYRHAQVDRYFAVDAEFTFRNQVGN